MINFTKIPLLTTALTFGVLSTASASLTEEASNAMHTLTKADAQFLATEYPGGKIGTQAPEDVEALKTDYTALRTLMADITPQGGVMGGILLDTYGPEIPPLAALDDPSASTLNRYMLMMKFRLLNIGKTGQGNQSGYFAGVPVTEDTVTSLQINTAFVRIANHG